MVLNCAGCGRLCASTQSLSRHQKTCKDFIDKFSAVPRSQSHQSSATTSAPSSSAAASYPGYLAGPRKDEARKQRQLDRAKAAINTTIAPSQIDDGAHMLEDAGMELDPYVPQDVVMAEETVPRARHERRTRGKLPARYVQDILPEGPGPFEDNNDDGYAAGPASEPAPAARRALQIGSVRVRLDTTRTHANGFGVSRRYFGRPTSVPDAFTPLEEMLNDNEAPSDGETAAFDDQPSIEDRIAEAIAPYPNFSAWLLNKHHWEFDSHSQENRRALVRNVLLHKLFEADELRGVSFEALDKELGRWDVEDPLLSLGKGWKRSPVRFEVPHGIKQSPPTAEESTFEAPGVLHRSIPDLVCDEFAKPSAASFHFTPFEETWHRPDGKPAEKMRGELFSSPAFIQAHEELQNLPAEPGCSLPRAVAGLCLMSDAAHLTDTGNAHIHPFNVAFANESMYARGKPSNHSVHPVMHLPALSDSDVSSFIERLTGTTKSKKNPIFTHCRREYFQGALKLLLNADFWDMYAHGRVVKCADGVTRRLYLRLFVYSADYPEKVLIATIRDGGLCPCPRCLVSKSDLDRLGTAEDAQTRETRRREDNPARQAKVKRARQTLKRGFAVGNAHAERELRSESYVATENAFSVRLENGVRMNVFDLLVVDLMHEIELGVWMALLAHLIRILYAIGQDNVQKLNQRYHSVPTFGRDIIRALSNHVADMTKMTAHEYANMLECAPPCFEGLFGEWDDEIQALLFTLARWHSLAKLRLHTDSTRSQLSKVTIDFADSIRKFQDGCCEAFDTVETPAELRRRLQRMQSAAAASGGSGAQSSGDTGRQRRKFNVQTYKFHSMGDYASTIARLGSTYNYTTAVNELSHRTPISAYKRSNKKDFEVQIVKQANIRAAHRDIQARLDQLQIVDVGNKSARKKRSDDHDDIAGDANRHHHIVLDESKPLYLKKWLADHKHDPALKNFESLLRDHCISRLRGDTEIAKKFPETEREEIVFQGGRIFPHARFRVNYTAYDMRRAQDCVNCNTRKCHIMVLSDDDDDADSPSRPAAFWYARVLGIFHARVYHPASGPEIIQFLWVRWFGADPDHLSGWGARRLDRVGYVPSSDPDAFGFLDPKLVLRAAHLIPAYAHGRTEDLLHASQYRDDVLDKSQYWEDEPGDWQYYYVNRFPDCDMLQRFTGLGIGHGSNRARYPDTTEIEVPDVSSAPRPEPAPGPQSTATPTPAEGPPSTHAHLQATDEEPADWEGEVQGEDDPPAEEHEEEGLEAQWIFTQYRDE